MCVYVDSSLCVVGNSHGGSDPLSLPVAGPILSLWLVQSSRRVQSSFPPRGGSNPPSLPVAGPILPPSPWRVQSSFPPRGGSNPPPPPPSGGSNPPSLPVVVQSSPPKQGLREEEKKVPNPIFFPNDGWINWLLSAPPPPLVVGPILPPSQWWSNPPPPSGGSNPPSLPVVIQSSLHVIFLPSQWSNPPTLGSDIPIAGPTLPPSLGSIHLCPVQSNGPAIHSEGSHPPSNLCSYSLFARGI